MKPLIESEKAIERKLGAEVKKLGGWTVKMLSGLITGLPDRLVLLPGGRVYFVELKSTGKKPTKIQSVIHEKLRGLGFKVFVVDSTEELTEFLELIDSLL